MYDSLYFIKCVVHAVRCLIIYVNMYYGQARVYTFYGLGFGLAVDCCVCSLRCLLVVVLLKYGCRWL